jgi:hypothetical protein
MRLPTAIILLVLSSCAGPTGPVPAKTVRAQLVGVWYNYDGYERMTLLESGRYTRSERYGRKDFSVVDQGTWRFGVSTILFTRVYWYFGTWWEYSWEVGYKVDDSTLWLGDGVYYREPPV